MNFIIKVEDVMDIIAMYWVIFNNSKSTDENIIKNSTFLLSDHYGSPKGPTDQD